MVYNVLNAMGNNQYGVLTDAEKLAAQQQEAAMYRDLRKKGETREQAGYAANDMASTRGNPRAMAAKVGPGAPADWERVNGKPRQSPEDFVLAQALQAASQGSREGGGLIVGPGRGQSDAQRMQERIGGMEGAAAEEIARARLMELRQGVRENRTQSPDDARLGDMLAQMKGPMRAGLAPRSEPMQPALPDYLSQGEGGMIRPQRPAAYAGNADPEDRRTQALADQKAGVRGTQPNPGMAGGAEKRRGLYEQYAFGGAKTPEDAEAAIIKARLARVTDAAVDDRIGEGDFTGAGEAAQGKLPSAPERAIFDADTLAQTLAQAAEQFAKADTEGFLGGDPTDQDIADLMAQRDELAQAFAREKRVPVEQGVAAANKILMAQLKPHAGAWRGGWVKKAIKQLRSPGAAATPEGPGLLDTANQATFRF